jgi:hypothetical protein
MNNYATATQTDSKTVFNELPLISQSVYGLGYGLDDQRTMVQFLAGREVSLFSIISRWATGPIQPLVHLLLEVVSSRVKRQKCEADHSPTSSAKVKNGGAIQPLVHMTSRHGPGII